jgi:hypothetical protein
VRPTWLIEAGVYGHEATPLLEEIQRQGMAAEVVPHQSLRKGLAPVVGGQPLPPEACVIGYGTFPFAQQILLHHRWAPGAWCSAANLDCATYFAYFGRYLLNQHYAIMPGVEAIRQRRGGIDGRELLISGCYGSSSTRAPAGRRKTPAEDRRWHPNPEEPIRATRRG